MPYVRFGALALALVALCIAYVPTRGEVFGPALVGDALSYAAMIARSDAVESPYRFRVVVPWLARLLPLAPAHALACVSYLSLAATYALVLATSRRLDVSAPFAVCGLLIAVLSPTHLYNYHNPYLTDASGLLVVSGCLLALLSGRFLVFAVVGTLGVGVRESLLVLMPSWAARRQYVLTALSMALPLLLYALLRFTIGMNPALNKGPFVFPARPLLDASREALLSWHVSWLLAPLGLTLCERARRELSLFAALLLAAALVTSLVASDTMRMFQPLFPVVALANARLVQCTWHAAPRATLALLATVVASSWVWHPVRFFQFAPNSLEERMAHGGALVLLSMCALAVAYVARRRPAPESCMASGYRERPAGAPGDGQA